MVMAEAKSPVHLHNTVIYCLRSTCKPRHEVTQHSLHKHHVLETLGMGAAVRGRRKKHIVHGPRYPGR
ncbi:hypothetical protein RRG08_018421, partial [Elysia crispata]